MKKENEEKIKVLNARINRYEASIKRSFDNTERARLDGEIRKCKAEIQKIKDSEREAPQVVHRIDDPTILESEEPGFSTNRSGSIKNLNNGNYAVMI